MNHPKNDRHFHLVRVREHQGIIRTMPAWVQAKGINVSIRDATNNTPIGFREVPSRVPDVKRLGEYVIVHEAGVDGEQPHQKNDVSPAACTLVRQAPSGTLHGDLQEE